MGDGEHGERTGEPRTEGASVGDEGEGDEQEEPGPDGDREPERVE
jgi:hypothetical protein